MQSKHVVTGQQGGTQGVGEGVSRGGCTNINFAGPNMPHFGFRLYATHNFDPRLCAGYITLHYITDIALVGVTSRCHSSEK